MQKGRKKKRINNLWTYFVDLLYDKSNTLEYSFTNSSSVILAFAGEVEGK